MCSAMNRESKLRSSIALASAPGEIPSSVTNVEIPNFISSLNHTEQVRHQLAYLTNFEPLRYKDIESEPMGTFKEREHRSSLL